MEHPTSPWSGLGLGLEQGLGLGLGLVGRPMDPKVPWDYRMGWIRGTKHIPDLGLVGCTMEIPRHHGTMGRPRTSYGKVGLPSCFVSSTAVRFVQFVNTHCLYGSVRNKTSVQLSSGVKKSVGVGNI